MDRELRKGVLQLSKLPASYLAQLYTWQELEKLAEHLKEAFELGVLLQREQMPEKPVLLGNRWGIFDRKATIHFLTAANERLVDPMYHSDYDGLCGTLVTKKSVKMRAPKDVNCIDCIKRFLSDDAEIQETWARNSGQPTRLSSLEKYAAINPMYTALLESLSVARPYPSIPEGTEMMDKMGTEVSLVMTGDKSPEEAAKSSPIARTGTGRRVRILAQIECRGK